MCGKTQNQADKTLTLKLVSIDSQESNKLFDIDSDHNEIKLKITKSNSCLQTDSPSWPSPNYYNLEEEDIFSKQITPMPREGG